MSKVKIILADDHAIVRDGIKASLNIEKSFSIVGEAANGFEAVELVKKLKPDVAVIDITMPVMNGIEAVKKINSLDTDTKCMILSMHDKEEYVMEAVSAGALGYLLKDTERDELIKAIKAVAKGEKYFSTPVSSILVSGFLQYVKGGGGATEESGLTKRERNILKLIVDGKSNREIAEDLDISIRTIETHRQNIMKKLKVKNAVEMVKLAMEQKLV